MNGNSTISDRHAFDTLLEEDIIEYTNEEGEFVVVSASTLLYYDVDVALHAWTLLDYFDDGDIYTGDNVYNAPPLKNISFGEAMAMITSFLDKIDESGYAYPSKVYHGSMKSITASLGRMHPNRDITDYVEADREGREFYYIEIPLYIDDWSCIDINLGEKYGRPPGMVAIVTDLGVAYFEIKASYINIAPLNDAMPLKPIAGIIADQGSSGVDVSEVHDIHIQYLAENKDHPRVEFRPVWSFYDTEGKLLSLYDAISGDKKDFVLSNAMDINEADGSK